YYRFSLFAQSPTAAQTLPYTRLIVPNQYVQPGQSITLWGANFATVPNDNTVTFELPNQAWTAAVTQAATNFLIATVPTNLIAATSGTGTLYRVSVRTSQGAGNGVGCSVQKSGNVFAMRPDNAYIARAPGSGKQTLVLGGGVPPYQLVPQSDADRQ